MCHRTIYKEKKGFSEAKRDREWLPVAIFFCLQTARACVERSSSSNIQVTEYSPGNNISEHAQIYVDNIIAFLVKKRLEYAILIWPLKALYKY